MKEGSSGRSDNIVPIFLKIKIMQAVLNLALQILFPSFFGSSFVTSQESRPYKWKTDAQQASRKSGPGCGSDSVVVVVQRATRVFEA